jgi:hypothetical protein
MKIAMGIAAVAMSTGVAVGLAGPASADATDDVVGTYIMTLGGDPTTWTITPCEADPARKPFIPCAHVADSGGKFLPWQADAHFSVGFWSMAVERADAISCDDGSTLPATVKYWWNPVSLIGHMGFFFTGGCGGVEAQSLDTPFILVRGSEAPPPPAPEV